MPPLVRLLPPNDSLLGPNDGMLPANDGLLPPNNRMGLPTASIWHAESTGFDGWRPKCEVGRWRWRCSSSQIRFSVDK
ncbi:hypothetical protein [Alloprevotella tannerae]|uniref:hypothetical protein n=1 Tax=Alloprevotella tannerae TaxID=76122 RepID=UPI00288B1AE7|nr:hypothetical protein [Alloprevotella tannerae]